VPKSRLLHWAAWVLSAGVPASSFTYERPSVNCATTLGGLYETSAPSISAFYFSRRTDRETPTGVPPSRKSRRADQDETPVDFS
jgi:hypothetical protein